MSNFAGVTFPYQTVTPSDHAIVNRAALTDGFLSGCTLTFAGTGLTMDAGHLILCGRHCRHTAIETWTVDGATSGYARLILTIDTTKTSTLDAFAQVEASVDYADAAEGFPALTQSDINADGVLYQAAACIVSLGSGGITGIVQQLPAASARGGGGLNFSVVGGTAQPADPVENMIWVNTDVEITDVVISNAPPLEHQTGTVWIKTGSSSYGQLNIAPAGTAMVYPLECWIYADDSASPVQAEAMTYRYGKWRDWGVYLYKAGYECVEITGGWSILDPLTGDVEVTDEAMIISVDDDTLSRYYRGICTKKPVDFTHINKLILTPGWIQKLGSDVMAVIWLLQTHPDNDNYWYERSKTLYNAVPSIDDWANAPHEIDCSYDSVAGSYYLFIGLKVQGSDAGRSVLNIEQVGIG